MLNIDELRALVSGLNANDCVVSRGADGIAWFPDTGCGKRCTRIVELGAFSNLQDPARYRELALPVGDLLSLIGLPPRSYCLGVAPTTDPEFRFAGEGLLCFYVDVDGNVEDTSLMGYVEGDDPGKMELGDGLVLGMGTFFVCDDEGMKDESIFIELLSLDYPCWELGQVEDNTFFGAFTGLLQKLGNVSVGAYFVFEGEAMTWLKKGLPKEPFEGLPDLDRDFVVQRKSGLWIGWGTICPGRPKGLYPFPYHFHALETDEEGNEENEGVWHMVSPIEGNLEMLIYPALEVQVIPWP